MWPLVFSITGEPRGKGRPRVDTRGRFPRIHTDSKTIKYERNVAKVAKLAMGARQPIDGPVSVSLRFRFALPKSMPKYQQRAILAGERAYTGGPDVDNLAKSILDGLNEIAFIDDRLIVRLFTTKVGAAKAGVDIRVEPLTPQAEA